MIELNCRSCGYLLQIEGLSESGAMECPFCGEAVMTGTGSTPGPLATKVPPPLPPTSGAQSPIASHASPEELAAMRYHKDLDYLLRAIRQPDESKSVDDLLSYVDCFADGIKSEIEYAYRDAEKARENEDLEILFAEFKRDGDFVHLLRKPTRKQARMALREVLKEGPLGEMKFVDKLSEMFPELKK